MCRERSIEGFGGDVQRALLAVGFNQREQALSCVASTLRWCEGIAVGSSLLTFTRLLPQSNARANNSTVFLFLCLFHTKREVGQSAVFTR